MRSKGCDEDEGVGYPSCIIYWVGKNDGDLHHVSATIINLCHEEVFCVVGPGL